MRLAVHRIGATPVCGVPPSSGGDEQLPLPQVGTVHSLKVSFPFAVPMSPVDRCHGCIGAFVTLMHLNWLWWFMPRHSPSCGRAPASSHRPWLRISDVAGFVGPTSDACAGGSTPGGLHCAKSKPGAGTAPLE